MARSSCIYLVLVNKKPFAAFTVKHEMQTFVDNFFKTAETTNSPIRVLRFRDNHPEADVEDITDESRYWRL